MAMKTIIARHWPGKAPDWADDDVDDDDGDIRMVIARSLDNLEERRGRRIRQAEAENVPIEEEVNRRQEDVVEVEDEEEDAFEGRRRRRIRERWLQREQEEEEEEEEETEYETDSEEEQTGILMVKPVFVPKAERDTIAERERLEAKERAHEEMTKRRVKQRKVETRQIVVEEIQKSEQIHRNMELEANITDNEDTDDEVKEAEKHKTREIEGSRELGRLGRRK